MHLLDKVFHHLNCRDTPLLNVESLSIEIIIAINAILNLDLIKKYENQYSIESCKKELFSKDDESFLTILKNSKVIELKEFQSWDWSQIDSLLDIIEIKKELMLELNKQKFFKKLLFSYSPSKNLIVKQVWMVNNFFYGAIGNKLFKILVNSQEGLSILDSPNEDYIFQKSNSWIKDVIQCMETLLEKNIPEDHPFSIKRIYNTLSKNIFTFIGIISNSNLGDDYLNKQGFYSELDKFISETNKFDYLLTSIIDNLNFKSKYVTLWIQKLGLNGNYQIKKYILNHIYCQLILGKELTIDFKLMFNLLSPDFPECNKIIISLFKILINKGIDFSDSFKDQSIIEKISKIDKSLLYILMRDPKIYEYLIEIINKEVENINFDEIVETYGNEMNRLIFETFENKDKNNDDYYFTINLSDINNKYHHYYEYFWIKQLPFHIVFTTLENKDKGNEYILNNYMEYNDDNILIIAQPQEPQKIIFDQSISEIQIKYLLGSITLSRNCNNINNTSNLFSFSLKDILKELISFDSIKNKFLFKKNGVNLILQLNEDKKSYSLDQISFIIRIKPDTIVSFKTPINLLTELSNNKKGYEKLIEIDAIEKLFSYLDIKNENDLDKNSKKIRSSLWIIVKIIIKKDFGEKIEIKYNICQRISTFYFKYNDCSIKGTILYLTSFSAQSKKIMDKLKNIHVAYFFNTNIGYPTIKSSMCIDKDYLYYNDKLDEDMKKIEYGIELNPISQEIYNNITNLVNNISFKQSYLKLDEIYRRNNQLFLDIKLYVKVYAALTKYKFKESARKIIMTLFEKCINSSEISLSCSQILKNLGGNLLYSHKLN